MSDQPENSMEGVEPTVADAVTDPNMVPFDDAAGGPDVSSDDDAPSDTPTKTQA